MDAVEKLNIKNEIVHHLSAYPSLQKIIIFGSFFVVSTPHDIDIAVIDNSGKDYMTLAIDYRKLLHSLAGRISVDLVPLKSMDSEGYMMCEIKKGQVVYER